MQEIAGSIHAPPRGERHVMLGFASQRTSISIHAPREGSDRSLHGSDCRLCISIHTPREGSDLKISKETLGEGLFQSTLPVRGATANALKIGRIYAFYYSTSA